MSRTMEQDSPSREVFAGGRYCGHTLGCAVIKGGECNCKHGARALRRDEWAGGVKTDPVEKDWRSLPKHYGDEQPLPSWQREAQAEYGRRMSPPDPVNRPSHYTAGGVECIDAIRAALTPDEFRGFCKGNQIKYVWRERHKGGDQSIEKAAWYGRQMTERKA